MLSLIRKLFRLRPPRYTADELGLLSTADLLQLLANERYYSDSETQRLIEGELAFRQQFQRGTAIHVCVPGKESVAGK